MFISFSNLVLTNNKMKKTSITTALLSIFLIVGCKKEIEKKDNKSKMIIYVYDNDTDTPLSGVTVNYKELNDLIGNVDETVITNQDGQATIEYIQNGASISRELSLSKDGYFSQRYVEWNSITIKLQEIKTAKIHVKNVPPGMNNDYVNIGVPCQADIVQWTQFHFDGIVDTTIYTQLDPRGERIDWIGNINPSTSIAIPKTSDDTLNFNVNY